jgi:hypothetical protein
VGGWGSGSNLRSAISTTSNAHRFDLMDLNGTEVLGPIHRELAERDDSLIEIEISVASDQGYWVRPWIGTRTGCETDSPYEVDRKLWLSETSMFVSVVCTRPNFGGRRLWLLCPRTNCARRCRVLYREWDTNPRAFACIRCARLAYSTQRESREDRLERRADRLASRLRLEPGSTNTYLKPKWMRYKTFQRIIDEIERMDSEWAPKLTKQFQPFLNSLGTFRNC